MAKTKGKIPVHCSYSEMANINELMPNPKNPNQHPDEQIAKLAKIIQSHGWRHPIVISKRSGFIVSGHCRLYAAQLLGVKSVPVDFQDFKSDAEELAVLLADNKIAELSDIDKSKESDIIRELEIADYNIELTAVDVDELEPVNMDYTEEKIRPYERTHILLSFSPEKLMEIEPYLKNIMQIEGVEVEQASN